MSAISRVNGRLFRFVFAAVVVALTSTPRGAESGLTVRITSPLGRIGAFTNLRIVAQVHNVEAALQPIRFFVDGKLYKTDEDGPPYAVEWVDENPFERRELSVEVEDSAGRIARDSVVLPAFDVVETADVSSVLLEAGVYDSKGRFVTNLPASSFSVLEDGVPQKVDVVSNEALPAIFAILIDSSHSMHRRIEFVREGVRRLIDFMRPADQVLVAPFSKQLEAITGPTSDRKTVLEAIGHVRATGGTAILDSLVEVVQKIPPGSGRHALVLVTDGYDEDSVTSIDDAIAAVKAVQVTIYVIAIGGVAGVSRTGERMLRRLATETGGRTFLPRDEALAQVHEHLAADVQNRYLVTYTPSNQKRDGTWRTVTLATTPNYTVRTRAGYTAPKPPPIRPELEFTITDRARRYLDLSPGDLVVIEDGAEQSVEAFHEVVAPVSIILALDSSGSMRKSAAEAVGAAREFVDAIRPEDSLGLLEFADQSTLLHDLTTSREALLKTISEYVAVGGTALYDALWDSLTRLQQVKGRRAIVLVTDGRDENNPGTAPGSVHTQSEVLELLSQADTTIYTIGVGPRVDRLFLEKVAERSSGESYFPDDVTGLQADYRRVVENLRRRYVVSYTSTNGARDGAWRKVEIRSRLDEVVVTSRGGYFAPER
jgi:VWFA-related protein